jgi:hypothetical protein
MSQPYENMSSDMSSFWPGVSSVADSTFGLDTATSLAPRHPDTEREAWLERTKGNHVVA